MCIRDGLFSAESGKWTRFGLCLNVSSFRITSWSVLALRSLHSFSSYSCTRMLPTILLSACCNSTSLPYPTHKHKLSWSRGFWDCWVLVTHRYYQNSCRCRWYLCRWRNRAQVGVRRGPWLLLCFVSWWSVVEPSWDDRGSSIWGYLLFFWMWP